MNQDKTKWMRFNKEVMPGGCAVPGGGCSGDELLTVTVVRDEHGYGMKVSGDNPVYVQSVKEHGAAWRAGLRAGDRILRVDGAPVHDQAHQTVVHMIRANPTAVLTVQPNAHRHITAPLPVNQEKQRQVEFTKVKTVQLMLDNERKYIWDLKNELSKVPDVRKQAQLELAEQRCTKLQQEIENMKASQSCQDVSCEAPRTPRADTASPPAASSAGFLSGLPRSLSNLTGQSLRNLRHARNATTRIHQLQQQPLPSVPPLIRQKSDEGKRRHNNTVPLVPTTCLDNAPPPPPPPPLPPRRDQHPPPPPPPASRRSLEPERDELQPNSIAMQMSYPLVNVSPPPLQTDNRTSIPVLHARSHSSPEQLDTTQLPHTANLCEEKDVTPPPGTPPPPYAHNTQPCADPQRAIISMEEDDSTASETSTSLGLFSNLKEVKESRARMAVLLNWLLGERRCACSCLFLLITDGYRTATGVANATFRRWAYEIQSTFLMPNAVLAITSVDENIANEIEQVLANDYDKDEILRNVFRKARQKAKEELSQLLTEFQRKRQVGLGTLYGPEDSVLLRCDADKAQELVVVERLVSGSIRAVAGGAARGCSNGVAGPDAHASLLAALVAAAHCLQARPHTIAAAAGGGRASFLLRDKHYKQRLKQLAKQPMIVRGHHLSLQAMTAASDCHHCDNVIWGLAPQAYVCTDCKLRVHRSCARIVEEPCCIDGSDQPKRISRFMERIQHNTNPNNAGQDTNEKKSRKSSATSHFLNMERSFRKNEDEQPWEQTVTMNNVQGESRREGSSEEAAGEADPDAPDAKDTEKDTSWRHLSAGGGRGVNRAESCRERGGSAAHVRRGKQRNASDPNRLTADQAHNDLEANAGGAGGAAPSGSSSSSSLSSRSNESNTAAPNHQAWQSEWSEEEEPLASAWADTVPAHVLDALELSPRHRKRQEVIHELIVSEGSHVRWLRVLGCVFLRPLERGEHSHLLTPDELRALFPNLPQVLERHMRLYTSLKQLRVGPNAEHAVRLRPLADVVLQTLGEPGYAVCVSRFCRGQRMALEALRERRRKNKELHQFLAAREQDPLCGRLQLRDLIACVWQRLTKYQLLLENILRTVMDDDEDSEEDVARLRLALDTAKEVLHSVDTAIRTAENDHRLRTIQNKLEVRVGSSSGGEFEELRRFELTRHSLRMEGDLMIRTDTNKRVPVLALMLEDCLVLLQREGDRFLLKPIPQPSQSGLLSPIVRWSTVLFRQNAAVRNAFFLMNLNGVQMHELSANTPAEYSMWCKYIQEAPLADARTGPHHAPARTQDETPSAGVTRNPSDASERSGSAPNESADAPLVEHPESAVVADASPPAPASPAPPAPPAPVTPAPSTPDPDKKQIPRRPTVGRISTHGPELTAPLEPSAALTVHPPAAHACAHTASRALTSQERLRRLDAAVGRALRAKSRLVGELLAVPSDACAASAMAELAVADALGQLDVNREMRLTAGEGFDEAESADSDGDAPDVHQLLLAAQAQANYLTMALTRALSVSEADVVSARGGGARGVCDSCARRRPLRRSSTLNAEDAAASPLLPAPTPPVPSQTSTTIAEAVNTSVEVPPQAGAELSDSTAATSPANAWTVLPAEDEQDPVAEPSYDTLRELGNDDMAPNYDDLEDSTAEPLLGCGNLSDIGGGGGAAVLASRLVGAACGLQATLGRLLAALPALDAHARAARVHLAHERDANDALRARLLHERASGNSSEPPDADADLQERPSSGG